MGRGEAGFAEGREHAVGIAVARVDRFRLEQEPPGKKLELSALRFAEAGDVFLELGLPRLITACRVDRRGSGLAEDCVKHLWRSTPAQHKRATQLRDGGMESFETAAEPPARCAAGL